LTGDDFQHAFAVRNEIILLNDFNQHFPDVLDDGIVLAFHPFLLILLESIPKLLVQLFNDLQFHGYPVGWCVVVPGEV
jgi:hypothetical protein